ncbi:Rossmann-fold NAD(P)-binding domain-containing protein [Oerskovia turbata]
MSKGPVRSRRSEDDLTVVVGEGRVAALVRAALGGRGPEVAPPEPNDLSAPWIEGVRTLVVVAPAGEFGVTEVKGETRRERLVEQARRVARAARRHGVEQVVAITSATVHGASPDRPDIDDDDPASPDAAGFVADLVAFEEALAEGLADVGPLAAVMPPVPNAPAVPGALDEAAPQAALDEAARTAQRALPAEPARSAPRLAVLRPAILVGPDVDTIWTRHFEAPRLLTVRGGDRPWQFLHTDDLVSAVRLVIDEGLTGALTAGALADGEPDTVTPAELTDRTGLATVTLPAATAFGAAERLHKVGVLPSPASDLAYVVHPWTVTARRLRDAGWEPAWSSPECVDVLIEGVRGRTALVGRRVGGRDAAALGAAGAAVALLGTAAIWRQARRR